MKKQTIERQEKELLAHRNALVGFPYVELLATHIRVDGVLDLYLKTRRFHNLITRQCGSYSLKNISGLIHGLETVRIKERGAKQ